VKGTVTSSDGGVLQSFTDMKVYNFVPEVPVALYANTTTFVTATTLYKEVSLLSELKKSKLFPAKNIEKPKKERCYVV